MVNSPKSRTVKLSSSAKAIHESLKEISANPGALRALRKLVAPLGKRTNSLSPQLLKSMAALKPYVRDPGVRFLLVSMANTKLRGRNAVLACWKSCMQKSSGGGPIDPPVFDDPFGEDFDAENQPQSDDWYKATMCWITCSMEVPQL